MLSFFRPKSHNAVAADLLRPTLLGTYGDARGPRLCVKKVQGEVSMYLLGKSSALLLPLHHLMRFAWTTHVSTFAPSTGYPRRASRPAGRGKERELSLLG